MYMTSADLRTKLLNDAQFAVQLQSDASEMHVDFDVLDSAGAQASAEKIDSNPNLLNSYINVISAISKNKTSRAYQHLPLYIRAPFGEQEFTINTNTRVITVPNDFVKNGVGVVGDHMAEILFFSLPRFFDVMDLNSCKIYIYWKNTGLKGDEAVNHVERPMAEYADGDMLYFGWALSKEVTVVAGTIEFGIEFVGAPESGDAINFRLVTQPAKLTIKPALEFDNAEALEANARDYEDIVYSREMYSNVINTLNGASPIITKNLDPEDNVFDETTNNIMFEINAVSPDQGDIVYKWIWNNISVTDSGDNINDPTTGAETYELIQPKAVSFSDPVSTTKINENDKVKTSFKKLTTNVPGTYSVYVGNRGLATTKQQKVVNGTPVVDEENNPVYETVVTGEKGIRYIFSNSVVIESAKPITLSDIANPQVIYLDGTNPNFTVDITGANGKLVYLWHHINPLPGDDNGKEIYHKNDQNQNMSPFRTNEDDELELVAGKVVSTTEPTFNPSSVSMLADTVIDPNLRGLWQCEALNQINNTQTHAYSNWIFYEIQPRKIDPINLSLEEKPGAYTYQLKINNLPFINAQYRMYAQVTLHYNTNNGNDIKVLDVASSHKIFEGSTMEFSIKDIAELKPDGQFDTFDVDVFVVPVTQYNTEFVRYPMTVVNGKQTIDYTRVNKSGILRTDLANE